MSCLACSLAVRICCWNQRHQTFPQFTLFYRLCVLSLALVFFISSIHIYKSKVILTFCVRPLNNRPQPFLSHVCFGIYKCACGKSSGGDSPFSWIRLSVVVSGPKIEVHAKKKSRRDGAGYAILSNPSSRKGKIKIMSKDFPLDPSDKIAVMHHNLNL